LFVYIGQRLMADVSQNLTMGLRKELSSKLNRLPLKYYDSHKKGDILSRATNDLERIADSLQEGLLPLIKAAVTIVIMLFINPFLTLIIVTALALSLFVTAKTSSKIEKRYANNQQALGELNSMIEETFTGQIIVKAFSRENQTLEDFRNVNQKLCDANRKAQFSVYAIYPLLTILEKISYVAVAVVGGIFVVNGAVTLGNIQAFIQYVHMCLEPATEASYILNMLQSAIASAERIFDILDEPEEIPDSPESKTIENPMGKVAFEHVKFGYRDDSILMKDINISMNTGDKIAIVGQTGAGKTTLVNLLMRFYEIQDGRITIDGVDTRELRRGNLRKMFGMVLQDTWLFHGSIQDNIAYGRPGAGMEQVALAAKAARAHHFIKTLPQGYQTILDEDGSNISQGQKQLLTIARAILADPSILILDEATSSVDTRTEAEIQEAMKQLMQGRTSFVIAHRLSTIRDADLILVMQNGTIVEQGNHKGLMARKGLYEQLYNSQFANRVVLGG
jgi:ATP-binding cassette subfamily B protein